MQGLKYLEENNLNDEFSLNDPGYTIAARYDLRKMNPTCYGATDAKFASINEIKTNGIKKVHIISGPTTSHDLENFVWTKAICQLKDPKRFNITGQVDEYNFDWVEYNLTLF